MDKTQVDMTVDSPATASSSGVKSADRLMILLEYLAANGQMPFSSIVKDLDLPNSSAHQLLQTAVHRGFIDLDSKARTYRLGLKILEIGQAYFRALDLPAIAQPYMDRLLLLLGETIQLAKLDGLDTIHIAVAKSDHAIKLITEVGMRRPAHATGLGKVLLASLSDDEIRARLKGVKLKAFSAHTITDHEELIEELHRVRERGFAEDSEEFAVGCKCFAMPLHNESGQTVAAMSVSIPTPRLTEEIARTALVRLGEMARSIEARLGSSE